MFSINTRSLLNKIRIELEETGVFPVAVNTSYGNILVADYFSEDAIQTLKLMASLKR